MQTRTGTDANTHRHGCTYNKRSNVNACVHAQPRKGSVRFCQTKIGVCPILPVGACTCCFAHRSACYLYFGLEKLCQFQQQCKNNICTKSLLSKPRKISCGQEDLRRSQKQIAAPTNVMPLLSAPCVHMGIPDYAARPEPREHTIVVRSCYCGVALS